MKAIWSAKAGITYFNVLDYLEKHWTKKEIIQFNNRTVMVIRANLSFFHNSSLVSIKIC